MPIYIDISYLGDVLKQQGVRGRECIFVWDLAILWLNNLNGFVTIDGKLFTSDLR